MQPSSSPALKGRSRDPQTFGHGAADSRATAARPVASEPVLSQAFVAGLTATVGARLDRSAGRQAIEVRVLGPLEVRVDEEPASLGGVKQRAVLAVLALSANSVVSTDLLIDQVWGESAGPGTRHALHVYLANLRKVLGDGARIEARGNGYVLEIETDYLDVRRFERLVGEGRAALGRGDHRLAAQMLHEALDLWRGEPLADFTYESFAAADIERFQQQRLAALEDRIEADLALGRHKQVVLELGDLVADNPLREGLRRQLVLALYRCGRQADALSMCKDGRQRLVEELGIEPSRELQDLERAILDHDGVLDAPTFVPVIDGLDRASASFGLAELTIANNNLPGQLTSFVGRERELAEINALLAFSRLVTLTGPGGSGKTRLALHVAGDALPRFSDGVWVADLAPLADAALVTATLAGALRVREDAARPTIETLIDAVRDRELLIVIDNCEHVIDAVAKLADALLRSCSAVALLATSREPLGVSGEHVYRVPTLDVPDAEEADLDVLTASDAVRLFAERVAQHQAGYALDSANAPIVARVCRRLDGIPLAIELAAARLRSVSMDELEARLDQRFQFLTGGIRTALPRQQTLQALIDWSWDLLTAAEQIVLTRLGVFAGSWDLEAAEFVAAGASIDTCEVLGLVGALVDKSLVQVDDASGVMRYRLLEIVREYANSKLVERGDEETAAANARHRDCYLALAESAAPHLITHRQTEWLDRLELEYGNLRTALAYSMSDSESEPGMRLAIGLKWLWQFRGPAAEGAEILRRLIKRPDANIPTLRGNAMVALAALLIETGEAHAASACADEALAIGRGKHDRNLEAEGLSALSIACLRPGNIDAALALADEGLAVARLVGDADLIARLLNTRGIALAQNGDNSGAQACYEEARDLCRQTGNRIHVAAVLNNLAVTELTAGDLGAARADLSEALTIERTTHDNSSMNAMFNLGLVEYLDDAHAQARALFTEVLSTARRAGDEHHAAYAVLGLALTTTAGPERSGTIHGAADKLFEHLGENLELIEAELRDADQARLRKALGAEAFDAAYFAGRTLSRDEAVALALQ